jgi:Ca-activated chloride channel family protein
MGTHDHDDKQIRDLFREARNEEETSVPSFEDVMAHEPAAAKPSWFTRLWTGPGLKLAMGSLATVMIAVWAASVFTEQNQGVIETPEGDVLTPVTVVEEPRQEAKELLDVIEDVEKDADEQAPPETIVVTKYTPPPAPADPEPEKQFRIEPPAAGDKGRLSSEGILAEKAKESIVEKKNAPLIASRGGKGEATSTYSDTIVQAPTVPGSRAQVNPNSIEEMDVMLDQPPLEDGRVRHYKTIVGGVSNVDPGYFGRRDDFNTESYAPIRENRFRGVVDHPLSTFSIDVDTASYANVRRYLQGGNMPPPDAVRIEELLNYFTYNDPAPRGKDPFSVNVEIADAPWNPNHRLARIGLKGREIRRGELEGSNLVFLLDVSGSMNTPNKLPLLKKAMGLLVDQLGRNDTVSIVVYAGASGMVLEPTSGNDKASIRQALERLSAGGGTNGGAGLQLAYDTARRSFLRGGVNRVILATDGDFNLGTTGKGQLLDLIERYAKEDNIFLTALGFGMGNYKDDMLEHLADKANGNYAYIDSLAEARKVLVEQVGGTLVTIAKDVKIQVEFNPAEVAAYRLIGYENRMLAKEDFNDDTKDAGEIGAGHSVTALYEIVPAGMEEGVEGSGVDPLKYQKPRTELKPSREAGNGESFTVKLRYKEPEGSRSKLLEVPVMDRGRGLRAASDDFRFASAVAAFGMKLRHSSHVADMNWNEIRRLAESGRDDDPGRYRAEFIELLRRVD